MKIAEIQVFFRVEGWSGRRWFWFWLFWSLLISSVYWLWGPYSYLRIQDTTDFNLPYRIAAARDFLTYGITYWQPKLSGGLPAWTLPQFDSFLLAGPPFYLLPPWAAYGFIMWLQRFVAGYFSYRLCRLLGLSPIASLFAGLAFSLNNWSSIDWTLYDGLGPPATPLYLFLFEGFIQHRSKIVAMILVGLLGIFVALVASSALYTVFFIAGLPVWFLLVRKRSLRDLWPYFLLFIAGAVLAEAPVVFAMLTFVPDSSRSVVIAPVLTNSPVAPVVPGMSEVLHRFRVQLGMSVSNLMLGYAAMAVFGMALVRQIDRLTLRLLLLLVITLVGAELLQIGQVIFHNLLPLSTGNLRDFNQFSIIVGVLAAAAGLHLTLRAVTELERVPSIWRRRLVVSIGGLVVLIPLLVWKDVAVNLARRSYSDNYSINFAAPSMEKLVAETKNSEPFRVTTLVANLPGVRSASGYHFYPAYAYAYGLHSSDGYYRMYPERLYDYWLLVLKDLLDEYPVIHNAMGKRQYLFAPLSHGFNRKRAIIPVVEKKAISFADLYNLDLLSLNNTRFIISHWPLIHPDLLLVHEPVEEQKVREQWQQFDWQQMVWGVLQKSPPPHALYIYENRAVLPRAFLAGKVEKFDGSVALLAAMSRRSASQLRASAMVEQGVNIDPAMHALPALKQAEVKLSYPRPDRVVIKSAADAASILVLTDNYDPYWRVWVDGVPTTIFPVYHLFRGVQLKKGSHEIIMEYWPPYRFGEAPG